MALYILKTSYPLMSLHQRWQFEMCRLKYVVIITWQLLTSMIKYSTGRGRAKYVMSLPNLSLSWRWRKRLENVNLFMPHWKLIPCIPVEEVTLIRLFMPKATEILTFIPSVLRNVTRSSKKKLRQFRNISQTLQVIWSRLQLHAGTEMRKCTLQIKSSGSNTFIQQRWHYIDKKWQ